MSRREVLKQRLEQLQAIRLSGAKSVSTDGVTVNFDPKVVNEEIAKIEAELYGQRRRPRAMNIRLD